MFDNPFSDTSSATAALVDSPTARALARAAAAQGVVLLQNSAGPNGHAMLPLPPIQSSTRIAVIGSLGGADAQAARMAQVGGYVDPSPHRLTTRLPVAYLHYN